MEEDERKLNGVEHVTQELTRKMLDIALPFQ
jgi:hypothetical protein